MQTPAEKQLIDWSAKELENKSEARIIDIGASKSVIVEEELLKRGLKFICDRIDVENCDIDKPYVGQTFISSIENCPLVPDNNYDLGFSNYVFEHIKDLASTAKEMSRILKVGSALIISLPNPQAPEFILAKYTPVSFHQLVRGEKIDEASEAFETFYSYKSIEEFKKIFVANGFSFEAEKFFPFTIGYLNRFKIIAPISRFYDWIIKMTGQKILMGQVCLVFRKK